MKRTVFLILLIAAAIFPVPIRAADDLTVYGIIAETNKYRTAAGLPPLMRSMTLESAASLRAIEMLSLQYFDHTAPDGKPFTAAMDAVRYRYFAAAENIARGDIEDNATLVWMWMESAGHRANIMNPQFTEIGVAVKYGELLGRKGWLAVQLFALPRAAVPAAGRCEAPAQCAR